MTRTTTSLGFEVFPAGWVANVWRGEESCGADCAYDGRAKSIAMQKITNSLVFVERWETLAAEAILKTLGITRAV